MKISGEFQKVHPIKQRILRDLLPNVFTVDSCCFFEIQCHECLLFPSSQSLCVLKLYQTLRVSIANCFM